MPPPGPPPPGPPAIEAEVGPPAGNVPLTLWPTVCTAHAPGATSSTPIAAISAAVRTWREPP